MRPRTAIAVLAAHLAVFYGAWVAVNRPAVAQALRVSVSLLVSAEAPSPTPEPAAQPVKTPDVAAPAPPQPQRPEILVADTSPMAVTPVVISTSQAIEAPQSGASNASAASPQASAVATAAAPAPRAEPSAPSELNSADYRIPPQLIYPAGSHAKGEAGTTVLHVLFDEEGRPVRIEVSVSSGHARLDAAAVSAMQRARAKPWLVQGRPTARLAIASLAFDL